MHRACQRRSISDYDTEVFGNVVEAYTMTEAVKDGITVNLVYEGRAAKVVLDNAKVREIEEYYEQCAMVKPYVNGAVSVDAKLVHSDMEVKNFAESL